MRGEYVTCKEFEKLIPDYVAKKLDYLTLKEFYAHMESCADCKEELTINFLVTDGIKKLENGDAYDLHKEWDNKVEETRRRIHRSDRVIRLGFWLEIFAVGIIAGIFLWLALP